MNWEPITREELEKVIEDEKFNLNTEELSFYNSICVPFEACQIERFGEIESVFIIAKHNENVVFYEDVEEGFEITKLDSSGVITEYGASQFGLKHVINQLIKQSNS